MTYLQREDMECRVQLYGVPVIFGGDHDEEILGFVCPSCGEPIYFEDWTDKDTENWLLCPICEDFFCEDENDEDEEDWEEE